MAGLPGGQPHPEAPHSFKASCDVCIFEAWERMTYGGVVLCHRDVTPPFTDYYRAYVERSTWPAGKSFAAFAREIWDFHLQRLNDAPR